MGSRRWTVMGACDLKDVLTGLRFRHFEFLHSSPLLYACHRGARAKTVLNGLAVKRDRYLDVTAAVNMGFDTGGTCVLAYDEKIVNRIVAIFKEDEHLRREPVLFNEERLESTERVFRADLYMVDIAHALALVEDIYACHDWSPLGGDGECPASLPVTVPLLT
jgi:hypothetical protein